jgi:hypothetical protein
VLGYPLAYWLARAPRCQAVGLFLLIMPLMGQRGDPSFRLDGHPLGRKGMINQALVALGLERRSSCFKANPRWS